MLIVFIIIFVGSVTVCDFSALFLDEELESILYYSDDEATAVAETEEAYAESAEENDEGQDVATTVTEVAAEDDFDSYDLDIELPSDVSMPDEIIADTIEFDPNAVSELINTDEIMKQIIQDAEII